MPKKCIENTISHNQSKSIYHFRFSLALCTKTTAYFLTKNIRLIKLSVSSLFTNFEGPTSILKGIIGHFNLQNIIHISVPF